MVGKFTGKDVPACGFSIGFERIVSILKSKYNELQRKTESIVYLVSPGIEKENLKNAFYEASLLRNAGTRVLVSPKLKNLKVQIQKLQEQGYSRFFDITGNNKREINTNR